MIIKEESIVRFVKLIAYSVGKTMEDVADIIGCSHDSISRRSNRTYKFTFLEIIKICKQCGYRIYIEKPDIKIDITEFLEEANS